MMNRTNRRYVWVPALALAGLLGLAACDGVPTANLETPGDPVPGVATVSVSANPDGIAAYAVTISGGPVDEVQAAGDGLLYWETVSGVTRVVGISPRPTAGVLFSIRLPDIGRIGGYRVQVDQAANVEHDVVDGAFAVKLDWAILP